MFSERMFQDGSYGYLDLKAKQFEDFYHESYDNLLYQ